MYQRGFIFSLAPRASNSGNLLAPSDFYWPRANWPVLVSIPEVAAYRRSRSDKSEGYLVIAGKCLFFNYLNETTTSFKISISKFITASYGT